MYSLTRFCSQVCCLCHISFDYLNRWCTVKNYCLVILWGTRQDKETLFFHACIFVSVNLFEYGTSLSIMVQMFYAFNTYINTVITISCVCVCVCVWERERGLFQFWGKIDKTMHFVWRPMELRAPEMVMMTGRSAYVLLVFVFIIKIDFVFCGVWVGIEETVHDLSLTVGAECVFVGCKNLLCVNSTLLCIP